MSPVRRAVILAIAAAMIGGGAWLLYEQFVVSTVVYGKFVFGGGMLLAVGLLLDLGGLPRSVAHSAKRRSQVVRLSALGAAIAAGLVSVPLFAGSGTFVMQFQSGNSLLALCDGGNQDRVACNYYIQGAIDQWASSSATGTPCPQLSDALSGQLIDTVKLFLRAHPELRHISGAELAVTAVKQAWKCP